MAGIERERTSGLVSRPEYPFEKAKADENVRGARPLRPTRWLRGRGRFQCQGDLARTANAEP
ncbi:hypothetical protein DF3PA_190055 [Candidatus Defluviicoccus seviourii]|uniref:Uncharacterized protein n=2 Tax=root TaxID=1 RepID=A0A564WD73_9PROT|nr:hypothetical protein DF3PB_1480002 [uncultured Defluviicoccus sp.]VUX46089.1 hypothetical protein DF3PA_190055 [Candidatus Defluviicoccus seviourii]